MKLITGKGLSRFWQLLYQWFESKFSDLTIDIRETADSSSAAVIDALPTDYAKQGDDATATNTALKQLILAEGIVNAHEYAQEINDNIGDWSNE